MDDKIIASIIVSVALVVSSLIISVNKVVAPTNTTPPVTPTPTTPTEALNISIRPPDESDWYWGPDKPDAIIVEYSDMECPFCKRVHPTITSIIQENTNIGWVYRHLPLNSIHPNANEAALYAECVGLEGGAQQFWGFVGSVFENQEVIGTELFDNITKELGVDINKVKECVKDPNTQKQVDEDLEDSKGAGAKGTPHFIILTKNGKVAPISGAVPKEEILGRINSLLEN